MEDLNHQFNSNFSFLETDFPILASLGTTAEYHLYTDPVVTIIRIRQLGERVSEILFNEHALEFPYDNSFHVRLKVLDDEGILPFRVKDLLFTIKNKGNLAVHQNKGTIDDGKTILFSAFKIAKWLSETYGTYTTLDKVKFNVPPDLDTRHALSLLEQNHKELEQKFDELLNQRKLEELSREQVKAIKERGHKASLRIDMNEAETRQLIDEQLRQAGWEANTQELNYKIKGTLPDRKRKIAIAEWKVGKKWADYALFIGKELYGIIEAKKYDQDISTDLRQSKIYAELAEEKNEAKLLGSWNQYKVPFLFSSNGRPYLKQIATKSGIWFLDARKDRERASALQGFYSPDGLIKLFEQNLKEAEDKLKEQKHDFLSSNIGLGLRAYQITAIQKVEEKILTNFDDRRSLLAMATGTGKTRTIIGLCYRLISTNRFKRILFLVDRTILGTQAIDAFNDNKIKDLNTFADTYGLDNLKTMVPDGENRIHFATVQGMVKRLFYSDATNSKLPIDTYDCIIVDEAHRGYLLDREIDEDDLNFKDQLDYVSKYRMVLEYFDAYAVGLTATPAFHTSEIFGEPVYNYSYREAVIDGFLIDHDPPHIIRTKLNEEGIVWKAGEKPKIYDKESNTIEVLAALEDELAIEIEGFNKMVVTESFNRTVAEELVKHLDPEGEEKTLIFAASDDHADTIVQILKEEFERIGIELNDNVIAKITGKAYDPPKLVKQFKNEKHQNIAVTVDLLSTGIDVPTICNIVFLRRIKSRILYEQMMGRATRKCDEIGKQAFQIFDAVRIYEALEHVTNMRPVVPNPKTSFTQLTNEFEKINKTERARLQLEQIVAKLQRKKNILNQNSEEDFRHLSGGQDIDTYIHDLLDGDVNQSSEKVVSNPELWKYLDQLKPTPRVTFYSEHADMHVGTDRGYGYGTKPEDYIQSFKSFIAENQNKIAALQIVCTRPKELDRASLKQLKLELDLAGFSSRALNTAWKATKNVDITADIISYIRTLALGSDLVSHEERIHKSVEKVRQLKDWNKTQMKWLDRIEIQLLNETILRVEDFNESPFKADGGFKRLNKIFDNQLEQLVGIINDGLYSDIA